MTAASAVMLREVADDDLPVFFEQQRDPAYNHMAAFTHKDPSDRAAFMAHWTRIRSDPTVIIKTVIFEGQVVGSVASFVMFGDREFLLRHKWLAGIVLACSTGLRPT